MISRPDVDADKIGVTGISGGGAATFWIAAADERVKVAVPVSGMSDLESYVKNKVINGHCDCMFLYNTYQWDWTTIAAMIAPRPLLFANSDTDPIFPMDANRRIIAKLRTCYKMHGQEGLVDEYVSKGGHDYRPDLRIAIFKFINKHLKGDTTTPVEDAKFTAIDGKLMRVFPTDDDLPKDRINGKIDETFVPRANVKLPEKGKFEEWKQDKITKLKDSVFRKIPSDILNPERMYLVTDQGLGGQDKVIVFLCEGAFYDKQKDFEAFAKKLLTAKESFTAWQPRFYFFPEDRMYSRDELHNWTKKSPPNYVERSLALIGRTIDELKVYHFAGYFRRYTKLIGEKDNPAKVVGVGEASVIAAYGALIEPSIKEVIVINPPKSHREGPYFLNVLRVLDIPEALGLLAPRPLTIVGGNDPAFDRTAEIYRRAGAEGKLTRK